MDAAGGEASSDASGDATADGPEAGSVCEAVYAPCGGDIVGTWNILDVCGGADPELVVTACPNAQATWTSSYSGAVTFDSNGTFTNSGQTNATVTVPIPAGCTATCLEVQSAIYVQLAPTSASCTGSSTCSCEVTSAGAPSGTYTTSGTNVTFAGLAGTYCVEGDRLRMRLSASVPPQTNVFERQK
jgi:hypothetical protein